MEEEIEEGGKVMFRGKIYDFGYISQTGMAVIYEEGECNLQDAYAVDPDEIQKVEHPFGSHKVRGEGRMINEVKAIRYAALLDEQHRKKHPTPKSGCKYCGFLEGKVCEYCNNKPCRCRSPRHPS